MDEIVIQEYDPRWPERFQEEAERLRAVLGESVVRTEHFGSTSVPGLAAKPVIDLLIGVRSLEEAKQAIPLLEAMGYAYWSEDTTPGRMFFVKGLPPNGPRSHHIHMVEPQHLFWERLLFRDYLRAHPDEARRYAALKQELAERFPTDREAYTDAKTDYIRTVTEKAKQENTGGYPPHHEEQ